MTRPNLSSTIEMAACSDTGRVRTNNEDSVLANAALGLAVLADGMGGYNAGEVASDMATTMLGSEMGHAFDKRSPCDVDVSGNAWVRTAIVDVIGRTNATIYLAAQGNPKYAGMGTTLVLTQFFDNRVMVAHIGDSRLYRWRDGEFEQLTKDHSLLQEQIDSGMLTPEQARFSRNRNLVTRALGIEANVETDVAEHEVRPDDVYLLCSDGLNDMVGDGEIANILSESSGDLPLCARQLVKVANGNGGRDNVSVILAKVLAPFPATAEHAGLIGRMQSWFKQ